jgi:hypothetical protein
VVGRCRDGMPVAGRHGSEAGWATMVCWKSVL